MEFFTARDTCFCISIASVNALLNFAVACMFGKFVEQKSWIMKAKVLLDYRTQKEKISLPHK